ncbi:metalloregulator ArsR/SmtB family transcription factor [Hydrogenophaga sp. PAMC20947]|uniref:ArsR/SmtB family transcription factor n=1 Tax=Hydrogenophaga sp. PAMC20947 TaxID=2565558 RepID=UPI001FFA0F67|nr:metalloregulator ArsR/SmtB family transcription factor [Hydrogenophaga sp. PAMC20947]
MQEVFESVARYFSVLGEPTRLRILHALCQEEQCVNEIIKATGLAQANVSRHLGLMYQAGMLSRRREGTQIIYKVADPLYVDLCRTVSVQLIGRIDTVFTSSDHQLQPAAEVFTGPIPIPANLKEEASV